mmetsp:Transcript_25114/g.58816  ORF Transcript_25114/g.58816 Transcript_25114/m.58816 type:complete len:112 (+) Transcript_25114:84-419(+)|eukprot:CAMPEP_0185799650 /NCGR_PEP_ID=MMETSP1322-20130828/444_1 /TAXON_ID=265543 /ORGANISM="Minutocellus polymorphus, Strain RCC2270" /LENGTH=111 /DNA_ID=CAMNT_0028495235 /DNA_START=67 /DNA_END=402 /DNA_ORIENTATION=+
MPSLTKIVAIAAVGAMSADAFVAPQSRQAMGPLRMAEEDNRPTAAGFTAERGVSVDQDGKSNVWAIEPKMEVDTKSAEEKTTGTLLAVGGLAAFAALAAGVLTNLPDPNQF